MTTTNSGRSAHIDRSEAWGYIVWGAMALVIAIPEITAAVDHARLKPHGRFFLGYVLYGLIAFVWIVVPSVLAFWFAKDIAFPPLFRTVAYLERRLHFVAAILLVGFVVLLIHLALYPWPNIFQPAAASAIRAFSLGVDWKSR
jgi:hypothetical protein